MTHPIHLCLWFNNNAQEAAQYYCSIFKKSQIISSNPFSVLFELNGFRIVALNGNKRHPFNESSSIVIHCETQEEIDYYWNKLSEDGEEQYCGWLKDKYGVSWQVVPSQLGGWLNNPKIVTQISEAVLTMRKFDLATLEQLATQVQ